MSMELLLNLLVAVLLVVTIAYCVALNRRLGRLRSAQDQFQTLLEGFRKATEQAETGIAELKEAGQELGGELQAKIDSARLLSDELSVMTQTGSDLADRLEYGLLQRRSRRDEETVERAGASGARSESERELLAALRQVK